MAKQTNLLPPLRIKSEQLNFLLTIWLEFLKDAKRYALAVAVGCY